MTRPYYPLFFDLADRLCLVIGGGRVAERKVRSLLEAGAKVRVVSPEITKGISRLAERGTVEVIHREYREGDIREAVLAFAATDREEVNRRVHEESHRLGVPLNVSDSPGLCDFLVPSLVRRGPILIAVSTSGLLPALSKRLRREILESLSVDYAIYARRVGVFRRFLIENVGSPHRRKEIMRRVSAADISEVARMSLKEMKERFLVPKR